MKYFLPIFKALDGIRYVTVGGIATVLNGYPRLTGDIDLILDISNRDNCLKALSQLHNLQMIPRVPVSIFDFADKEKRTDWIENKGMLVLSVWSPLFPLIEVDIFVAEPVPFDELFKNSKLISIEDVQIRIACIDDLISLKKLAGRPKDLDDIENLLIIKQNKDMQTL